MNIAVCAKVAPDSTAQIKVKADGSGIDRAGIKFSISAYDEFAIEEAVSLKEKGRAGKVHLCTIGDEEAVNQLKSNGLARGADDLTVCGDAAAIGADSLGVATGLAAMIRGLADVQLVFCGKQAIDDDNVQVPAMLAELLGWPHVSFVSAFSLDGATWHATRNVGGGVQEVVSGSLPVVITTDKGLNTPRYPKLPDIMKAKTKPVHRKTPADLGLAGYASAVVTSGFSPPASRPKGRVLTGDVAAQVRELVRLLRDEAKVL
ncbi:MAG TPA: electron transfer flavoprotein subunit beta/FixA family protein [Myxococcota bacterium]|nr:electron transfer flavoprotein subunit beta/FixA family protein [Myxococcota bacterium]